MAAVKKPKDPELTAAAARVVDCYDTAGGRSTVAAGAGSSRARDMDDAVRELRRALLDRGQHVALEHHPGDPVARGK